MNTGKQINHKQEALYFLIALLLTVCIVFCCSCSPCNSANHKGFLFPKSMVGIWVAEIDQYPHNWYIKIEENGSIRLIQHYLAGKVDIDKGGVEFKGRDEAFFMFVFDSARAVYEPNENMVFIRVLVPYYRMELPGGVLEGSLEDVFEGQVSTDGKEWKAFWINKGEVEGAIQVPDELLRENKREIMFRKTDSAN